MLWLMHLHLHYGNSHQALLQWLALQAVASVTKAHSLLAVFIQRHCADYGAAFIYTYQPAVLKHKLV